MPTSKSSTPLNNLKIAIAKRAAELWRLVDRMVPGYLLPASVLTP
jgi:hypothetical protein